MSYMWPQYTWSYPSYACPWATGDEYSAYWASSSTFLATIPLFQPAFWDRVPRPFFKRDLNERGGGQEPNAPPAADAPSASDAGQATADKGPAGADAEKAPEKLGAVVSVKKSSRGCAVVLLRDLELLERCVLQKVAVVDGVCVEIRRHVRRSLTEEEKAANQGLFIAWGHKVERKVTVSEVGLEAYFNSLAGTPCPDGLVATPPFEECHLRFPLKSNGGAALAAEVELDVADQERMLSSAYCPRDAVEGLWKAKARMDDLWKEPPPPLARSVMTRVARAELFPHSGVGGKQHENRAGDKLAQLAEAVGLLNGIPPGSAFLDLCGGPGAWSQHLLARKELQLQGFGFTLRAGSGDSADWQAEEKDEWYDSLYQHPDWTALWGADGTGDLLKPCNLEHVARELSKEAVMLCVADGGFSDSAIPPNLLELYFYRLFLGEVLMAASCLQSGGKFVCKLYTTFSAASASLLWLTTQMFESVTIVKPMSSRATGPERYLFASGFRKNKRTARIRSALSRAHRIGAGRSPLTTPLLTPSVCLNDLMKDKAFTESMREMVTTLCERQSKALNAVVDRAKFLEDMAVATAVSEDSEWYRDAAAAAERRREAAALLEASEENGEKWDGDGRSRHRGFVFGNNERLDGYSAWWYYYFGPQWYSFAEYYMGGSTWSRRDTGAAHSDGRHGYSSVPTPARGWTRHSSRQKGSKAWQRDKKTR